MNRYGNICHKDLREVVRSGEKNEERREENNGVGDGAALRDGKDKNLPHSRNLPNLKL